MHHAFKLNRWQHPAMQHVAMFIFYLAITAFKRQQFMKCVIQDVLVKLHDAIMQQLQRTKTTFFRQMQSIVWKDSSFMCHVGR